MNIITTITSVDVFFTSSLFPQSFPVLPSIYIFLTFLNFLFSFSFLFSQFPFTVSRFLPAILYSSLHPLGPSWKPKQTTSTSLRILTQHTGLWLILIRDNSGTPSLMLLTIRMTLLGVGVSVVGKTWCACKERDREGKEKYKRIGCPVFRCWNKRENVWTLENSVFAFETLNKPCVVSEELLHLIAWYTSKRSWRVLRAFN